MDPGDDGARAPATFLRARQGPRTAEALCQRVSQTSWWDALRQSELGCASLLDLRVGDVRFSGHNLAGAALALRHIELAQNLLLDPTSARDAPPPGISAWLREP